VYTFLDSVVDESSSERLLGVTINNDLSWNTQVENVIKNVIHVFTYYLDLKSLSFQKRKRFYNAYILAYFDLCCVIWGNCTSIMEDKLQKRAARAILDVDVTVPSETMFTQLKWMTFPERVVYHKAIQMYQPVCGDAPDYIKNGFVFTSEIHSRLLRSSSNFQLYTPRPNTE